MKSTKKLTLAFVIVTVTACSIRPKQWIGVGLTLAPAPVNLGVQSQPVRIGATLALLATAITIFELDARRDRTGESVDFTVVSDLRALSEGDYVQEVCSPNVMICLGPYRAHRIEAVVALPGHRYRIGTQIVATIPVGAVVHRVVVPGPAEVAALGAAWATVESLCECGCADRTTGTGEP